MSAWIPLDYSHDAATGNIVLPDAAPFDGESVLVKTNAGIVEAWWAKWEPRPTLEDEKDGVGWHWVAYDDEFQLEVDDVKAWMPIPQ